MRRADRDGPELSRTEKLATTVARRIVRDIAARKLPPGARLAAEQKMLEIYHVGRASLREALRLLEAQGIIWVKPGPNGGPVVGAPGAREFGRMAAMYLQLDGATLRDLVQSRLLIEPMMAGYLARQPPPDLRRRLEESILGNGSVDMSDSEYVHASSEFHSVITGMSGNKVLDLFIRSLKSVYDDRVGVYAFPPDQREAAMQDHIEITRAILAGDERGAEGLMREHMQAFVDFLAAGNPALLDEIIDWAPAN
jgi:GntR family transcriptional repressor for pyruvate dehydrogenase complex